MGNKNSTDKGLSMNVGSIRSALRETPKITESSSLAERELAATELAMEEHVKNRELDANETSEKNIEPEDNSAFEYNYKKLTLPKDEDGYVIAFDPSQEEEYLAFFRKYGCVVVKNVLTDEECSKSESEVWDFLERQAIPEFPLDRNDPATWENWPSLKHLGILGNTVILSPQMCQNRQNPKIYRVFSVLHDSPNMWVSVDRLSAMRPTRNVKIHKKEGSDKGVDKPEWKTASEWLHWDLNPWTGKASTYAFNVRDRKANRGYDLKVQGVLSLVDCHEKSGGFHCVPGFQDHLRGWANANMKHFNAKYSDTTYQVPSGDPIRKDTQTVPIRKGCILIWHSALPHGTFPNDGENLRMIQYLKMFPDSDQSIEPWLKRELLPRSKEGFQLTELGEKLLGFKKWE